MKDSSRDGSLDKRILIFAPVGKDAPLTLDVLRRTDLSGCVCPTAHGLCLEFQRGAAVIMLTEEALEDSGIDELMECLRSQPAWSDVPVLLFADAERSEIYLRTLRLLEGLRNVVLLERPIRLGAALSLIRSAMRGRDRQYELRDLLKAFADAREEAETANRLKDEFLATLSHELRTPLNAILGWTTMLRDGNVQPRHVMRALDTIHRNATAQVQIVNDLLDVSRIVRGNVLLSPRLMPLGPLLALSVESIAPTAEVKGVTITNSLGTTPVSVWADHDRMQQVFWNLLSNAVKFTSSGGRVEVRMQVEGSDVRVDVIDTGNGIAAAFLPHVFERFRQADGSSTRTHGGLGLGLSIGRHLVELHGGRMTAESPGEGQGSTFSVYLPVREAEQRPAPAASRQRRPRTRKLDLEGTHILIVDDEPDAREMLRVMLSSSSARISEADSAAEALRIYAEDRPEIILADIAMPGQDGYALIRAIRSLPGGDGAHVRAIAVSAYARREDRQRALKAGFNDHVCKPVQPDDICDAIERVWEQNAPEVVDDDGEQSVKVHYGFLARFKVFIEYAGTKYSGWQIQKNARTVQGELTRVIAEVTGQNQFELYGSGRTDAGVHALEQVAHLDIITSIPAETLRRRVNDALPSDIHLLKVELAQRKFHARHDAVSRSYLYQISRRRSAFAKNFVWWVRDDLDLAKMRAAAEHFSGMRDFRSFTDDSADEKSTVVGIERIEIAEDGDLVVVRVEGSHFLWKMVRRMVGVMVDVAIGGTSIEQAGSFLRADSAIPAKLTAPASGLFLERVYYRGETRRPALGGCVQVKFPR